MVHRDWTERHIIEMIKQEAGGGSSSASSINPWTAGVVKAGIERIDISPQVIDWTNNLLTCRIRDKNYPYDARVENFGTTTVPGDKVLCDVTLTLNSPFAPVPSNGLIGYVAYPDFYGSYSVVRADEDDTILDFINYPWLENYRFRPDVLGGTDLFLGNITWVPTTYTVNGYTIPCYSVHCSRSSGMFDVQTVRYEVEI